jgi:hypothetical protein
VQLWQCRAVSQLGTPQTPQTKGFQFQHNKSTIFDGSKLAPATCEDELMNQHQSVEVFTIGHPKVWSGVRPFKLKHRMAGHGLLWVLTLGHRRFDILMLMQRYDIYRYIMIYIYTRTTIYKWYTDIIEK